MKKLLTLPLCLSLAFAGLALTCSAWATDLPSGVLNYVRQKDPQVKVRFDGMILFSNGETYVPVIPQDASLNPESQQVVMTAPTNAQYPDLIEFDNHLFLLRLIQTSSGRLTFPKMAEYPIQLKEGLLPQDFVMPPNLYMPVELKVLLGALPYNPTHDPKEQPAPPPHLEGLAGNRLAYVFDLNTQRMTAIDPIFGHKQNEVALDCIPSALQLSPDNKLLFAACLSTDELIVIDTSSNLVKTRVPVGQRPDKILYLDGLNAVVVSNRYSPFLSIVNTQELLTAEKLNLVTSPPTTTSTTPAPTSKIAAGALAKVPGDPVHLVVADAFKPQVYWVNLNTRMVEKTLKAVPDISAIKVTLGEQGQADIWVASRTQNKVAKLNLTQDKPLLTLDVGTKPVEMALYANRLFVLSAGAAKVDVIDWTKGTLLEPIALTPDSFPSAMAAVPSEHKAYITMAGNSEMAVIDLESAQLESSMPVDFRANIIASTPDPKGEAAQANTIAKQTLPDIKPEAVKVFIGPEAPSVETSDNSSNKHRKHNKKKKDQAPPQNIGPTQTVKAMPVDTDGNTPRVMPVLRNDVASPLNNNSLNNGRSFNIPLSRAKAKIPSENSVTPPPPMLEENIAK